MKEQKCPSVVDTSWKINVTSVSQDRCRLEARWLKRLKMTSRCNSSILPSRWKEKEGEGDGELFALCNGFRCWMEILCHFWASFTVHLRCMIMISYIISLLMCVLVSGVRERVERFDLVSTMMTTCKWSGCPCASSCKCCEIKKWTAQYEWEKRKVEVKSESESNVHTQMHWMHSERWRGRERSKKAQMPLAKRNKLLPFFKLREKRRRRRKEKAKNLAWKV